MKKSIHSLFLIFTFTLFTACESDPCDSVVCYNGGTCVEGTCDCSTSDGWEGEGCATEVNEKFDGFTFLSETLSTGETRSYDVEVTASNTSATKIRIEGLDNFAGMPADGWVNGFNGKDFGIPRASYGATEIEGEGTMNENGDKIIMTYRMYDYGSETENYSSTATITM